MFERVRWIVLTSLLACTARETEAPVVAAQAGPSAPPVRARLQVAAGLQNTCAVLAGQVFCWGYNGHGQLGDGTRTDRRVPAAVVGVDEAVTVVLGAWHACALRRDGSVVCWGDATVGQVGDGGDGTRTTAVAVDGLAGVTALAAGATRTCALGQVGKVWCWGDRHGDIDDASGSARPREVAGFTGATAIAVGSDYACAVVHGRVRCWGQPPLPDDVTAGEPGVVVEVPGLHDLVEVAAGQHHACARDRGGRVHCWGEGREGQRGDGVFDPMPERWHGPHPPPHRAPPRKVVTVAGLTDVVRIAAGSDYSCALERGGALRCWGANREGQVGDGGDAPQATPVLVPVGAVADMSLGSAHACAVLRDGGARCWGYNDVGQADNSAPGEAMAPYVAFSVPGPKDMSKSASSVLKDRSAAELPGSTGRAPVPGDMSKPASSVSKDRSAAELPGSTGRAPVSGDKPAASGPVRGDMSPDLAAGVLAASGRHACLVRGGGVECIGDNGFGQLGDGTWTSRATPVRVPGVVDAVQVVAGERHSCVRRATGEVLCWGDDTFGQLGQPGEPVGEPRDEHGMGPPPAPAKDRSRATPVVVAGLAGARQLAARGHYTCALQDAGVLRCWHGEGAAALAEPVQLPRDTVEVGLGAVHSCARRAGGEVLCWGLNFYGRIGDGTRIDRPQPTPVKGLGDATGLAVGLLHSCALRRGGTVVCWGSGFGGRLGDGAAEERASIVTVEGLRGVREIVAGEDHTCALGSQGEVHCWGSNDAGALGDGTHNTRLVPTLVTRLGPASLLAAGEQLSCAQLRAGDVQCWGTDLRAQGSERTWAVARTPVAITGLPMLAK